MKRVDIILLIIIALSVLPSCQKEILSPDSDQPTAAIDSLTLTLSLNVAPVAETKGSTRVATKGSEAEKAGFYYEFVPDTTELIQTKAPASLKNVYAFLFNGTTGAYVGKGTLTSASANAKLDIKFSQTSATNNCRLIVVAQDGGATLTLPSALTGFTGTYDQFKNVYLLYEVTSDTNIPYVGELTGVSAVSGSVGSSYTVNLYRMLAKVTLNITNNISELSSFSMLMSNVPEYNFFGTSNNYDGSGTTPTTGTFRNKEKSGSGTFTWYAGENIQGNTIGSCTSMQDRNSGNAPSSATYIEMNSPFSSSTSAGAIVYDIYLGTGIASGAYGDFNLRRNHNYIINSTISGTLEDQIALSKSDKRIHSLSIDKSKTSLTIPASGGSVSLPLVLPDEDAWGISQSGGSTAITCAIRNGTGSGTVTFSASENLTGSSIMAEFRCELNGGTTGVFVTITQKSITLPPTGSYVGNYQVASVAGGATAYNEAMNYCYDLVSDGYSGDWYLPSESVLRTLFAASLGDSYKLAALEGHWSSNIYGGSGSYYFHLVYGSGASDFRQIGPAQNLDEQLNGGNVRCIRTWR